MPERPIIAAYAEDISYDEFTAIYELPTDTTIWRIFNTGEQAIYWSEFEKPASRGEKGYHTLLAHSAEVPIIIPNIIYLRRSNQDSKPRVEILWTRSKDPTDMARLAGGGLYLGKHIVTTTSGKGIEARVSGETVIAKISGEVVRISGGTITANISGETVTAKISGEAVRISGETVRVNVVSSVPPTIIRVDQVQFDDTTPKIIGSAEVQAVTIKGLSDNSGDIYIGVSGISGNNSYILGPDGTVNVDIDNLNRIFGLAQISGDSSCYLANY